MVQALANPSVRINNVTISIVPNSFKTNLGLGETNVRSASAGGNSVESVHTSNAESKIGKMSFEVYNTPDNIKAISGWKSNIGSNAISSLEDLGDDGVLSLSLTRASLMNDPDIELGADTTTSLEWEGDPIVVG